jgi:hypothetical protein
MAAAFDPAVYGDEVARILALDGNGERLMPLTQSGCTSAAAREMVGASKLPELVRAGLYLYFGCWSEAHELADNGTTDGAYWHGIIHRQEPDPGNSAYWFRQTGRHPVFPALRDRASKIGIDFGAEWDPFAFIDYCGRARSGSEEERKAREVQRAEWQLLFDRCAR